MKALTNKLKSAGVEVLYENSIEDAILYTCILGVYNIEFKYLYGSDESILIFSYNNKVMYNTAGNTDIVINKLQLLCSKYNDLLKIIKEIIIYVDMDGVLADFCTKYAKQLIEEPNIKYPQSQWGFFRDLDPIKDAVETYQWLNSHFTTHILTAPSFMNPLCYTEKRDWVGNYLGMEAADKMIICGYKNLCKGNYLIDDNNIGKGQDLFDGELLHFHQENNNWNNIKELLVNKHLNIFK